MLDRISSLLNRKKTPFAGLKASQAWWHALGERDAATQLQQAQQAISAHFVPERQFSREELESLLWLDAVVQPALDAVCYQYVSNPRMPKETERKIWREVSGFCACLVQAYECFIRAEDDPASNCAKDLPLMLARALRYVAIQTKWHYFRFEKVPSRLWKQASQYYRLAEIGGFDCNPLYLYREISDQVSSCADEYLQMLMLATLSSNNLTVAQIYAVDQWLENWSKLLQLERTFNPDIHHYRVALNDPSGPQKITHQSAEEGYRFWGIESLVCEVRKMLACMDAGESPKTLGLGTTLSSIAVAELLRHLDTFWSMGMRNALIPRNPRVKVNRSINVLRGLDNIFAAVKEDNDRHNKQNSTTDGSLHAAYDEIVDMRLYGFVSSRTRTKQANAPYVLQARDNESAVTWEVDNESIGGLGATLDFQKNEWARPGALVALRTSREDGWKVAVLRRINRLSEERLYAGIQVLASTPVSVTLLAEGEERIDKITVTEIGYGGQFELPDARMAVYLPHKIDNSLVNTLIMRPADYGQSRIYQVRAHGKSFYVSIGNVLEKGSDWIWVVVNVLRQEKG